MRQRRENKSLSALGRTAISIEYLFLYLPHVFVPGRKNVPEGLRFSALTDEENEGRIDVALRRFSAQVFLLK